MSSQFFLTTEQTARLLVNDDEDGIKVVNNTKQGYIDGKVGGALNLARAGSNSIRGRVIDGGNTVPTIDTTRQVGVIVSGGEGAEVKIRRLTPRECFRLQGMPDEYFERASLVNTEAQLYKQIGNSVTVNVIYEIARRLI